MVLQVFPEPSTSSVNGQAFKVPGKGTKYQLTGTFKSGVYTITCATATVATVTFNYGTTFSNAVTVSGTVTYNLASDADAVFVSINTGTDIVVSITKTSESIPGAGISGTLDTITSTGTYSTTGKLYVVVIGGGAGGGMGQSAGNGYPGGGGGSGGIDSGFVYTTSSTSVTVGAVAAGNVEPQNTGGTSSFGAFFSATGGQSGRNGDYAGAGGDGGSPNGSGGTSSQYTSADSTSPSNSPAVIGSASENVSGGSGGCLGGTPGIPGGNGGRGGSTALGAAANATGYGSGGGGGKVNTSRDGGTGTPGVIYVLRGF